MKKSKKWQKRKNNDLFSFFFTAFFSGICFSDMGLLKSSRFDLNLLFMEQSLYIHSIGSFRAKGALTFTSTGTPS